MNKVERKLIFDKYNGRCAYCGCELEKGWHVNHIDPVIRDSRKSFFRPENDCLNNCNPSCPSCNIQKNSFTVEQFRENIENFVNSLNKYSTQYKFAKKYGLISENPVFKVKFYFENFTY